MVNIQNGIITMNRGDTFYMPLLINIGVEENKNKSKQDPRNYIDRYYKITNKDTIYFALEEYNQPFEFALIRKVFTIDDVNEDGDVIIKFSSEDTQYLLPGEYYYEIKLRHVENVNPYNEQEFIDTIVPRRKFIILE